MGIRQWGDVWEDKIKEQDEVGVIRGTNTSIDEVIRELNHNTELFSSWIFPILTKNANILDCGTGPMARHAIMFSKNGHKVTGVDISKTTLEHARKWARKEGQEINFIQANLVDLSEVKGKYDMVFCTQTFFHIPAYLALTVLKEFRGKTKKNGYCLIQIGIETEKSFLQLFREFLYKSIFLIKKRFYKTFPVNCSLYTEDEINDLIKRSGFKLIGQKEGFYLLEKNE